MNDFKYLYYLTKVDGLGSVRIKRLLEKFNSPEEVFNSAAAELAEVENISIKTAGEILSFKKSFPETEKEYSALLNKLDKMKIGVISYINNDYPELLKKIYDPPLILFYKGSYNKESLANCIGIVGTRKPTDYGRNVSEMFALELSNIGIAVVSGFARGVDTIAHKSVLDNKNSTAVTAAVFGCGVDVIYPPENYERMVSEGVIISEYEPSSIPDAVNFPKRNRVISGISHGVLIIESGVDGGAMITARCALDQSREVFAVPGSIGSKTSSGTNSLIKNSQAKLVENLDDILEEVQNKMLNLALNYKNNGKAKNSVNLDLKGNEKLIYDVILNKTEPLHIDSISEASGLNISDSLVTLLSLEFKGCVEQLPGKRFKAR
ncbi:MAG: DNA-processing protein DprA [Chlorobi bacterium]|nr:DNA-processing protein DprA [Chlorobiota bacterium]MCI0717138.1 DNA-processing protein DprA [Chlorobiota bacterium]